MNIIRHLRLRNFKILKCCENMMGIAMSKGIDAKKTKESRK